MSRIVCERVNGNDSGPTCNVISNCISQIINVEAQIVLTSKKSYETYTTYIVKHNAYRCYILNSVSQSYCLLNFSKNNSYIQVYSLWSNIHTPYRSILLKYEPQRIKTVYPLQNLCIQYLLVIWYPCIWNSHPTSKHFKQIYHF
jgi:hypothetical protein